MITHPSRAAKPLAVSAAPAFRADIQGLRAVAVIVVVLDHLFGWPVGGFVGVDVFFVVSGFLITGLMLREHERTGQISWIGFYKRRVRRIMPAATVCLAVVVAAAYLIYRTARFDAIRDDAVWSFFFMSNWHFAEVGTDYFQADGPVSPLQHFWSLAVEEQFYIVWPAMLILVLGLIGRQLRIRGRSANKALATVILAIVAASFLWAVLQTASAPTWAYFSTFTRGWELATGALLAVCATRLKNIPPTLRPLLSIVGLAAILAALFLISPTSAFPGPWAALPVAGAVLVLAAGVGGQPRYSWALTNPASVYVGKISYSLYLWHFPVIIMLAAFTPDGSPEYYVWAVVGITLLSVASFHLVEDPVRKSTWLDPGANQRTARRRRDRTGPSPLGYVYLTLLFVVVTTTVVLALQRPDPVLNLKQIGQAAEAEGGGSPGGVVSTDNLPAVGSRAQQDLSAEISSALAATSWPDLDPSIDQVTAETDTPERSAGCTHTDLSKEESCSFGRTGMKTIVVWGDSMALALMPSVRAAYERDFHVKGIILVGCPQIDIQIRFNATETSDQCNDFRAAARETIIAAKPDLILITNNYNAAQVHTDDGSANEAWRRAEASTIQSLRDAGRVVVLSPPFGGIDPSKCYTNLSFPSDCVSQIADVWAGVLNADRAAASAGGAGYLDTRTWYCSQGGRCPLFAGSTPIKTDYIHTSQEYAIKLAPILHDSLEPYLQKSG